MNKTKDTFCRQLFFLIAAVFLFQQNKVVAALPIQSCESYFGKIDVLQTLTPKEWEAFTSAVVSFVRLEGLTDTISLHAKEDLQKQLLQLQRNKKYTAKQSSHFAHLFQDHVGRHKSSLQTVPIELLLSKSIQSYKAALHFDYEKLRLKRYQDLLLLLAKHQVDTVDEALVKICNIKYSADGRTVETTPEQEIENIKFLLEFGADVNYNEQSNAPLHNAVQANSLPVVELLIQAGVNIDLKAKNGMMTALMLASKYKYTSILKFLLQEGAQLEATDSSGWTSAIYASSYGNLEILKLLIEADKTLNIQSSGYSKALFYAVSNDQHKIAQFLIQQGVDVSMIHDNATALMRAAQRGSVESVRMLLDAGADMTIKNKLGRNALYYGKRFPEIRKMLKDHKKAHALWNVP